MKALLICPAERPNVSALAERVPLANLRIFGKPFVHHWLEFLAGTGVTEIEILAADRPHQIRKLVGDGARWGLRVKVIPESRELSCDEARLKYLNSAEENTSDKRIQIVLLDHLPGWPDQKLFESYAAFFSVLQFWLSQHSPQKQVGVKEIKPGVWVGMRTQISPRARLIAPCWIGENISIKPEVIIGPNAILENGVVVEKATTIYDSWIGPQTFVGSLIQIKDSLVLGNGLVNFQTDSVAKIPDEFLLSALRDRKHAVHSGNILGRFAAAVALTASFPFALFTICKAKWQNQRAFRPRRAATSSSISENSSPIIYFEFANSNGWWRRWPQLWNIARGEFTWIGNRPLTLVEAGKLTNDFERLWLAAPIGLISQGDAEGCSDINSDEARAHASFYATQANWRLDCTIFFRALVRLILLKPPLTNQSKSSEIKSRPVDFDRAIIR